jgi:anti-sigma-K factor RskA
MASAEFDPRDDAAEYVLGTLDAAERAAFEARMARDPALAADMAAWERRLAALNETTPAAEPPAHIYERILSRIDAAGANNVIQLQQRVRQWRVATAAFAALAAALIIFFAVRGIPTPLPENNLYVAVLQGSDAQPAFVAAVDVNAKTMVVRRVGAATPEGHSYELWALGGGRAAPQPLGVIDAAMRVSSDRLGGGPVDATTLAVSLEPPGGSPTGAPTGPVLFTGKLISTR